MATPVSPHRGRTSSADRRSRQQPGALQQRIKQQQQALASLKAAEAQLKAALSQTAQQLSAINANQAQLTTQIDQATAALAACRRITRTSSASWPHLDWTLGILQDEQQQSEAALAARRQLLADRLSQAYQTQQTSLLEQVLSADSFTTVLSQVSDYLSQGDQDAALAAEIQQDQAALQVLQATPQAARYQTDQLRADVAQQATQMQAQEAAAQGRQAPAGPPPRRPRSSRPSSWRPTSAATKNQAQAAALLRREQQSEADLQHQIDAADRGPVAGWRHPVAVQRQVHLADRRPITQEFGCTGFPAEPPLGNCAHFHRGIDIAAPYGAPIHAAGDGIVEFVG